MAEHHDHAHPQDDAHTHVRGTMDISAQQKMFAGFMRFWVYLFGGSIAILIFLALFNS